jgi:hypothetical protein
LTELAFAGFAPLAESTISGAVLTGSRVKKKVTTRFS